MLALSSPMFDPQAPPEPEDQYLPSVPDMSEYGQLLEHIQYLGLLQPSAPIEQFLLTGVEDLQRQQALLAYVIYRYRDSRAHIQKAIRDAYANQRKQYAYTLAQYLQSPNPSTGKSWAVEAAKELSKGDASWIAWAHYISELEFRDAQLEAYIEALDAKKTLLPALQGKENRLGR